MRQINFFNYRKIKLQCVRLVCVLIITVGCVWRKKILKIVSIRKGKYDTKFLQGKVGSRSHWSSQSCDLSHICRQINVVLAKSSVISCLACQRLQRCYFEWMSYISSERLSMLFSKHFSCFKNISEKRSAKRSKLFSEHFSEMIHKYFQNFFRTLPMPPSEFFQNTFQGCLQNTSEHFSESFSGMFSEHF